MPVFDNGYSRLVFWAKVILPLIALAILSTLFLLSRNISGTAVLPYAAEDIDALVRDPRLTRPEYAGVTEDGARVTIGVSIARPGTGDAAGATIEGLIATYETADGLRVGLRAEAGRLDEAARIVELTGDVRMQTSTGFSLAAERLVSSLDRTLITSDTPVATEAPFGRIESGGMTLRRDEGASQGHVLVFNRGVRMLYQPPN